MKIVGCDFHPGHQQIAVVDTLSGEVRELKLTHQEGHAERFYQELEAPALIGIEAVGNSQWFVDLAQRLGHEVWIGNAAEIRASYVRKQKTDKRDASHLLKLLLEGRFPRIWVPDAGQRDTRQMLIHRHKLVSIRTRIKTELQHLAMNQGMQQKRRLWTAEGMEAFKNLPLENWSGCRRRDLLRLLGMLEEQIAALNTAVERAAGESAQARLLMTQPGVGPITALAFAVTIGDAGRFQRGKQVASYLGLIPSERSSGNSRRLGAITKQGNVFLRTLLVEAAQSAVRHDETFRKEYRHRCHSKPKGVAKVAAARKLAVKLFWMLRNQQPQPGHTEGSPSHSLVGAS
jgi:transposase